RRAINQRVAHILLHLNDPHHANKIMKEGLYICKERLTPHKDKKEPTRCAKCQCWGHIAGNCHADRETCAKCGGDHRSNLCASYNARYCVNCEDCNHASSDCHCTIYIQQCTLLDAKHPENSMLYFPTEETST
ncbi:hypothetical protein PAXRUDRAFT_109257, partial [Paxillus rubicundulus Ve08.2h10]